MTTLLALFLLTLHLPSLSSLLHLPPLPAPPPPFYHTLLSRTHLLHETLLTINILTHNRLAHLLSAYTHDLLNFRDGSLFNTLWQLVWIGTSLWHRECVLPLWLKNLSLLLYSWDPPIDSLGIYGLGPLAGLPGLGAVRDVVMAAGLGEGGLWVEDEGDGGGGGGGEGDGGEGGGDEGDGDEANGEQVRRPRRDMNRRSATRTVWIVFVASAKLIYLVVTVREPNWDVLLAVMECLREFARLSGEEEERRE
ncbi:hypothetical protein MMC30_002501 [Trapelia coarctata]|nr:hypothetical protein [Trapelia coarctata]